MRGSVKKYGSSWCVTFDLGIDPATGKRRQKRKRGFVTRKEAETALTKMITDAEDGLFDQSDRVTVTDFLEQWLASKESTVRKSTYRSYAWLVKMHIVPHLGKAKLTDLTPIQLQKYYTKLQKLDKPLSNRSILHIHIVLQEALDRAMKWGLLNRNVAKLVDPPRAKKVQFTVWTQKEAAKFLNACREDRYYIAFLLAIMTGMRKGEVLGLRWQDVDIEQSLISVRQTLSYTGKGSEFQAPKTEHGKRAIAIPTQVVEALKRHKRQQAQEKLMLGQEYQDNDLVVATRFGTFVTARNLDRSWYQYLDELDVPRIRFHDLRHTHASLMLLQGVHPKVVSERLGHANIGITLDTYSHVMPGLQEKAAAKFADELFAESADDKSVM